jgi:Mg-chelatase subunit ChlI
LPREWTSSATRTGRTTRGYNWTRLRFARAVADVLPGSSVVIGSAIGRYPAKVIAWDFEVSDDDPIVTLELLP